MPEPTLEDRLAEERLGPGKFTLPVVFDLAGIISIAGLLQLAMRHPGTRGAPTAKIARAFVDTVESALEAYGYTAHAELVRMGNDPAADRPAKPVILT